ncbi:hypothetical protein GCM10017673_22280 [Streptosporangium violaceochromogenes]|nr:hypothetical protein GCM10017673_22280 [Streptosporangium violaceochromogenes]
MGRHGAHGEDARRNRGKHEPETAPESDTPPDTPREPADASTSTPRETVGRRLRPEESAITEPPTGFLGSGWSTTAELSEPVWPEDRRGSRGRLKPVLLAVAAVAMVAGGTVAGIQMVSDPASSATDCPVAGCLAAASNQPEPYIALTEPAEEPPPTRRAESEGETDLPSAPAPVTTPRHADPTMRARPAPRPTGAPAPRRSPSARPTGEPGPAPTMTEEAVISDTRPRTPAAPTDPPVSDPPADPSASAEPAVVSGGATVTLGFDVVKEKGPAYTAQLVVAAGEALDGVTLSLPVGGEVTSVRGAGWRQTGDTLVIEPARTLEAGEKLVVTFNAYGRARAPRTCQSTQGDCVVV